MDSQFMTVYSGSFCLSKNHMSDWTFVLGLQYPVNIMGVLEKEEDEMYKIIPKSQNSDTAI